MLVFIAAGLLLNITPGPDVLYIVGRSLSQGRRAGVVSALGIGFGCLFHILAAAFGLSALVLQVPIAYDLIRYAGAAYLAWMGIRALRSRAGMGEVTVLQPEPLRAVFRQGVLTNVLNPKVALFFLAFLPQFTDPARGPLFSQIVLLGLVFTINGTLVCIGYALAASWLGSWLQSRYKVSLWLNRGMGGLFLALGLKLALSERH